MSNMTDKDFIMELSKPVKPDYSDWGQEEAHDFMAKQERYIQQLEKMFGKYKPMEIKFGAGDHWNTFVEHMEDIVFIIKKAPQWISVIVRVIQVIQHLKEYFMDSKKWFDIVTTVLGLIYAVWQGVLPVLQGDFEWAKVISAVLVAVVAYFAQTKGSPAKKK